MKSAFIIIIIFFIKCSLCLAIEYTDTLRYNDSSYTYRLEIFKNNLKSDSLISLLFSVKTLKELGKYIDTFEVKTHTDTYQDVYARFHYFTFKGYSRYLRFIDKSNDSISIILKEFKHNWDVIPAPKSFCAYYKINKSGSGGTIIYNQSVTLRKKKIKKIYMIIVQWQMKRFSRKLIKLIEKMHT